MNHKLPVGDLLKLVSLTDLTFRTKNKRNAIEVFKILSRTAFNIWYIPTKISWSTLLVRKTLWCHVMSNFRSL